MKMQLQNLICGKKDKKGFVFILDSLIAMIVLFLIIGVSSYHVSKSESEISKIQISRTGSDIITLLENKGAFNSFDISIIQGNLSEILPQSYKINLNLTCEDETLTTSSGIIIGDEIPEKEFIASGRRFFVITHNNSADFCMAQYQIWQE